MNCPDCNKEIVQGSNGYAFPSCAHSYGQYNVYYVAAGKDYWINVWAEARLVTAVYKWAKLSEARISALELLL